MLRAQHILMFRRFPRSVDSRNRRAIPSESFGGMLMTHVMLRHTLITNGLLQANDTIIASNRLLDCRKTMASPLAPACVALLVCLCLAHPSDAHPFAPLGPYKGASRRAAGLSNQRDLVSRCAERRHNTTLDHYDWVRLCSA